jgi:hypothetical protein
VNCNAHCRSCGGHFSSTSAFDRHRVGPWDDRRCLEPDEFKRLYGYTGDCDLLGGEAETDVPVFSTKKGEE